MAPTATDSPPRICPHCGFQERSTRERCSRCGKSTLIRAPRLRGRTRSAVMWGGAAALILVAAAIALIFDAITDNRDKREARQTAAAVKAERARLARLQAPHDGAAPQLEPAAGASRSEQLKARAALVTAAETSITRDARARAERGEIKGPISDTECGPLLKAKDAVPDDRTLSKHIGRYDCVAVKRDIALETGQSVGRLGYAFVAALNFDTYHYVWCRNTPAQGEAGKALAFVRLERKCLAAKGRALGTGYVDVPGS